MFVCSVEDSASQAHLLTSSGLVSLQKLLFFLNFTLGMERKKNSVSGSWHSLVRVHSRHPQKCRLCTLVVLHFGVPVM